MNWVDIAIIVILGLSTLIGIKKGFVASVTSVACIVVSIIAAKIYYKTVALFLLDHTTLKDIIIKYMADKNMLKGFGGFLPSNSMTTFYSEYFMKDIQTFISIAIINLIAMIGIFLVARILLSIAERYIKDVSKLPCLNEFNKLGGGAIGFAKAVLILLLVFAVIIPMSSIMPWQGLKDVVSNSLLAKYFYSYNFILGWIWNSAVELIK